MIRIAQHSRKYIGGADIMKLQKVFEYEYNDDWYNYTLHTYYKSVNCWLYVERSFYPEYVERTTIVDNLFES